MELQPFVWCIVANMCDERCAGPGGVELWHGTKHFSPGTRLYCPGYPLHDDGRIRVYGRHRNGGRFVDMIVRSEWLINVRVKAVYDPKVIRRATLDGIVPSPMDEAARLDLEEWAARVRQYGDNTKMPRLIARSTGEER